MTTASMPWTSGAARLRRRRAILASIALSTALVLASGAVLYAAGALGLPGAGVGTIEGAVGTPADAPGVPADAPGVPGAAPGAAGPEPGDAAAPPAAERPEPPELPESPGSPESREPPASPEPPDDDPPGGETPGGETADDDSLDGDPADGDTARDGTPDGTPDVTAVQERLRELGYLIGPADGVQGQQTTAAVMAFQAVNGLQVDGIVGPQTLGALDAPPVGEPPLRDGPPDRLEVDLDLQVLHVVRGGERLVTLKVSSGDGTPYRTASGGTAYSNTPVGSFEVVRRIHGVRESRLGTLYDPLYFYRGFAIHGSPSVPPGPASHGCIRVARADARWLIGEIPNRTPVLIHGGTHVFTPSR